MLAYVAVVMEDGSHVRIADSDEKGHSAILGDSRVFARHEDAEKAAAEGNADMGISPREAAAVKLCSMFRPGDYAEVLALF